MQVNELMSRDPACCGRDASLREVARMMADHDCGEIPVVDPAGKPLGVVTDRDICCRAVAQGKNPLDMHAGDVMSSPCVTVKADISLEECLRLVEEKQIRRVPVVDAAGVVCGIVAQADLARRSPNKEDVAEAVEKISRPRGKT